jgi:hypothetical protein
MITKLDAAERQLNTSIRLFFENRDHLSSYALTAASREITDDLVEKKSGEIFQRELARLGDPTKVRLSFREEFCNLINQEHHKKALKLIRQWQNFLKHADNDPDCEMDDLSPKALALNITFACWNFRLLTNRSTGEMTKFVIWFYSAHPEYTKLSTDPLSVAFAQSQEACPDDPYDSAVFEAIYYSLSDKDMIRQRLGQSAP